jgi:preprotein translocase subunit SecD
MQARSNEREEFLMKITVVFFTVFLTLTTFEWRVAEGGPLKEALRQGVDLADGADLILQIDTNKPTEDEKKIMPKVAAPGRQLNGRQGSKPQLRSLEFAALANARMHKEIIRQALASPYAVLRRDRRVIAAWREVAWNENNKGGVRKQKPVFADDSSQTVQREVDRNGQKVRELLVVYPPPKRRVTGKYLSQAYRSIDPRGRPVVGFSFDNQGSVLFGRLTREYAPLPEGFHCRLAILINDQIYSAPQVNEPIDGGRGIIDAQFTTREVDELIKTVSRAVPQINGEGGNETPAVKALPQK